MGERDILIIGAFAIFAWVIDLFVIKPIIWFFRKKKEELHKFEIDMFRRELLKAKFKNLKGLSQSKLIEEVNTILASCSYTSDSLITSFYKRDFDGRGPMYIALSILKQVNSGRSDDAKEFVKQVPDRAARVVIVAYIAAIKSTKGGWESFQG